MCRWDGFFAWVFLCTRRDDVVLEGVRCCGRAAGHIELHEDVADVPRNGLLADREIVCDCAVRLAARNELQHLDLASGEGAIVRLRRRAPRRVETGEIVGRTEHRERAMGGGQ